MKMGKGILVATKNSLMRASNEQLAKHEFHRGGYHKERSNTKDPELTVIRTCGRYVAQQYQHRRALHYWQRDRLIFYLCKQFEDRLRTEFPDDESDAREKSPPSSFDSRADAPPAKSAGVPSPRMKVVVP